MSFTYIKDYYGVPAKRGARVEADGKAGRIISAVGQYLYIRLDHDGKRHGPYHPVWHMHYIDAPVPETCSCGRPRWMFVTCRNCRGAICRGCHVMTECGVMCWDCTKERGVRRGA